MKKIGVWLDDQYIPDGKPQYIDDWHYCKNFDEFTEFVQNHFKVTGEFPALFALTHDLCLEHTKAESIRYPSAPIFYSKFKELTGFHAVKWLIEFSKEHQVMIGKIAVHGNNELGKVNMMYELQKYKNDTGDPIPAFTMNWKLIKRESE